MRSLYPFWTVVVVPYRNQITPPFRHTLNPSTSKGPLSQCPYTPPTAPHSPPSASPPPPPGQHTHATPQPQLIALNHQLNVRPSPHTRLGWTPGRVQACHKSDIVCSTPGWGPGENLCHCAGSEIPATTASAGQTGSLGSVTRMPGAGRAMVACNRGETGPT
jgi:hypothetical protein